jgi:hypothetical protein
MIKRLFLLLLTLALTSQSFAQQFITWDFMSNVRWTKTYVPSLKGHYEMPRFSIDIKAIDGKEITMKGFFMPFDGGNKLFAISQYPSNMCFFCGAAGYASVAEVIPKANQSKAFKRLKTDKFIEVKGTLWLNTTEQDHLMFVLKDAELVSVIK